MPRSKRRYKPPVIATDPAHHDTSHAPRVSALRPDIRVPGNLVVEIEGARFASIPSERASALGLTAGVMLDAEAVAALERVADAESAYGVAVRLLAARPYSCAELRRKLKVKGHAAAAIREVVERLESCGLLDDAEFARHFARVRLSRGHGPPRILTDLLAKGVADRVAKDAVADVIEGEDVDVAAQARALAVKRAAQLGAVPRETKLRRLVTYLARRGYRGRDATELVMEILNAEADCTARDAPRP